MAPAPSSEADHPPSGTPQAASEESHHALWDAISMLLNSESWDAARKVVNDNPYLTEWKADKLLGQLVAQMHIEGNTQVAEYIDLHRRVLSLARDIGIDEAFNQLQNVEPLSTALNRDEVLDVVVHNTLAVLTVAPGELPSWQRTVSALWSQAEAADDQSLANFLIGVSALLDGEAAEMLDLELDDDATRAWERLLSELPRPQAPIGRMCDSIVKTTLTALGDMPLMRQPWRETCQHLARVADDLGDGELAALARAVGALFDGSDPATITPELSTSAYLACWAAIREGVASLDV